jgi:hypothetical protein
MIQNSYIINHHKNIVVSHRRFGMLFNTYKYTDVIAEIAYFMKIWLPKSIEMFQKYFYLSLVLFYAFDTLMQTDFYAVTYESDFRSLFSCSRI